MDKHAYKFCDKKDHEDMQLNMICLAKTCEKDRLNCVICLESGKHENHIENWGLRKIQKIEELYNQFNQKLMNTKDLLINKLNDQELIISEVKSKFMDKLNFNPESIDNILKDGTISTNFEYNNLLNNFIEKINLTQKKSNLNSTQA